MHQQTPDKKINLLHGSHGYTNMHGKRMVKNTARMYGQKYWDGTKTKTKNNNSKANQDEDE